MRVLQVFKPGMSNLNPGCPTFSNVRSPLSTPGAPRFQTWNLHCQRGVRRVFKRGIWRTPTCHPDCGLVWAALWYPRSAPRFQTRAERDSIVSAAIQRRNNLAHSDVRPRSERPGAPRLRIREGRSERPGAPRLRTRVGSVVVSTQPISARGVPRVFKRGRNVIQSSRLQSSVETTWRTPTYDPGRNDLRHPVCGFVRAGRNDLGHPVCGLVWAALWYPRSRYPHAGCPAFSNAGGM
jgi:hypothetical protein